jgi:hypothetical protein
MKMLWTCIVAMLLALPMTACDRNQFPPDEPPGTERPHNPDAVGLPHDDDIVVPDLDDDDGRRRSRTTPDTTTSVPATPPAPSSDPEQEVRRVLGQMVTAMRNDDPDAAVAVMNASGDRRAALRASVNTMLAGENFIEALKAEYGENLGNDDGMTMTLSTNIPTAKQVEDLNVSVDGQQATVSGEGMDEPMTLTRIDGTWKIEPPAAFLPPGADAAAAIEAFNNLTTKIQALKARVGEEGETGTDLAAEFMQTMMETLAPLMGGPGGPPPTM